MTNTKEDAFSHKEYLVEFTHHDDPKGHPKAETIILSHPINDENGLTDSLKCEGYNNVEIINYRIATPEDLMMILTEYYKD